ncbi:MAG: hypothetical protein ACO32R_06400, partial [Ilumatobacteraceae bacterium]
ELQQAVAPLLKELPEGVSATRHGTLKLHGFNNAIEVSILSGRPVIAERNDTSEIWTRQPFLG